MIRPFLITVTTSCLAAASLCFWAGPAQQWHISEDHMIPSRPVQPGEVWIAPAWSHFEEQSIRLLEIRWVQNPDIAILGSSRGFRIQSSYFRPSVKLLNLTLSHAAVEQMLNLWGALLERSGRPAYVLVLVDPWELNQNEHFHLQHLTHLSRFLEHTLQGGRLEGLLPRAPIAQEAEFASYPSQASALMSGWKHRYEQFSNSADPLGRIIELAYEVPKLLTWNRVVYAIKSLLYKYSGEDLKPRIIPEKDLLRGNAGYRWDGSINYPQLLTSDAEIRLKAIAEVHREEASFPWALNENEVQLLTLFTADTIHHHVHVMILLPPYHPAAYQTYKEKYPTTLLGYTQAVQSIQHQLPGVVFCNALDASSSDCSEDEFDDDIHMRDSCVPKVLKRCMGPDPDWNKLMASTSLSSASPLQ